MVRKYALGMLKVSLKHFFDMDDCVVDHLLNQGRLHATAGRDRILHFQQGAAQWVHAHIGRNGYDTNRQPAI